VILNVDALVATVGPNEMVPPLIVVPRLSVPVSVGFILIDDEVDDVPIVIV
jgi:hypothetical protein